MSIQTKTSLPIIVEQMSTITGQSISKKELFNVIAIMNDFGPGSYYVFYKEESRLLYSPNAGHLGGFNGMVKRLVDGGVGDVPLNAIQKSLFFAAFPNSAKKKLSAFKTPNEVLNWFKNSPEEVMAAGEVQLWEMSTDVKQHRAAQVLNTAELRAYLADGTLPPRFKKPVEPASAVAPDTKVQVPVPITWCDASGNTLNSAHIAVTAT